MSFSMRITFTVKQLKEVLEFLCWQIDHNSSVLSANARALDVLEHACDDLRECINVLQKELREYNND